ncbi:hypothetical protein Ancab_038300 [Ancistrocladus abbreviatus]
MRSERIASSEKLADKENGDKDATEHLTAGARPGDVMWVKLRGSSWWPAQVINDSTVSRTNKPRKRIGDAILVRLYGSYKYLYVDPMRSLSEFRKILKQHDGSHREIFRKTLEKELSESSSGVSETANCKSEETVENGASRKKLKKNGKLELPNSELTSEKSGDLGMRRLKVMQGLGLVAPPGSPF